jgi:hypothetical protein
LDKSKTNIFISLYFTELWPQAKLSKHELTCPAHVCHTCAIENPEAQTLKGAGALIKCVRCPTAFHYNDFCIAAGTLDDVNLIDVRRR